jgi:cardiolipin synthase
VAAAPVVCYLLASGSPGPAVALLGVAGFTDFLDGHLARRLGHTSVLGSYLDPLGDKVLAASVAVTLASLGAAPWWLATLVAGRDGALMWGVYKARLRAFGGVWPGRRKFFDVDGVMGTADGGEEGEKSENGKGGGGGGGKSGGGGRGKGGAMPPLKPLLVSKANTVVQLLFFGGCIGRLWLGEAVVPRAWLDAGEALTALTTAASAGAYLDELRRGKLPTVLGGGGGGGDDNDKRS